MSDNTIYEFGAMYNQKECRGLRVRIGYYVFIMFIIMIIKINVCVLPRKEDAEATVSFL